MLRRLKHEDHACLSYRVRLGHKTRVQWLRGLAALTENLGSIPSTHIRWLIIAF